MKPERTSTGRTHLVSDPDGVRYEASTVSQSVRTGGRIVVGVDGSEASVEALRHGVRMAEALNASVEAVTSWRFGGYASVGAEFIDSAQDDARAILMNASTEVFGEKAPGWFSVAVREGDAHEVLIDSSRDAEMLVLGSRGHGGIAGVLLRSVSALCAERASCPVMIVH